jgi:uncharacterized protein (UPF0276 family)
MTHALSAAAVGVGWRPELAADLLSAPSAVDLVEVVAETCFAQPAAWREARALAELWPVVPHGVKLSLGSAGPLDRERARRLGRLARELGAPAVSEHVALTRAGGKEIGHLTGLPFTRDAVKVLARNVDAARRLLPDVPLLLENVAWTFRWPEDEMAEADFYHEVVQATGCALLLDVANLYANARNAGLDPGRALDAHPLDRVAMVHVAGGVLEEGFYLDTHAHAVPDGVFALLERLCERIGPRPVVLERDGAFPPFADVLAELRRLRSVVDRPGPARNPPTGARRPVMDTDRGSPPPSAEAATAMAHRQAALAERLVGGPAAPEPGDGFDQAALRRTRRVLQHKRVDDALPLLPRTAALGEAARGAAFAALREAPRFPRGAGIEDALRIAAAAARDPRLAACAGRDLAELRARFVAGGLADARPRFGPFLGRTPLPDGRSVWAVKGPGREAAVRLFEFGGER